MFGSKKVEKKKSQFAKLNENIPCGYLDADFTVIVDKKTGVNYIYEYTTDNTHGYAFAVLTPRLQADGKPVVSDISIFENES